MKGLDLFLSVIPALWNVYPVKCAAYFSGAEPIPPGSIERKKHVPSVCSVYPVDPEDRTGAPLR